MQGGIYPLVSLEKGILYDGTSSVNFITQKEKTGPAYF